MPSTHNYGILFVEGVWGTCNIQTALREKSQEAQTEVIPRRAGDPVPTLGCIWSPEKDILM